METVSKKKICIGILGGGQLARMSAIQAYKLGFDVAILEKELNSPAGQTTKYDFAGWFDNKKVLKKFVQKADIITLENEFIDYKKLESLESLGKEVRPSPETISLIQDKFIQKETLRKNGIPTADYVKMEEDDDYKSVSDKLGKKFILKSRVMGYDGYGNYEVNSRKSYIEGIQKLSSRNSKLFAEKFVDFGLELAVMVVRSKNETRTYPVVETIQKNHICDTVIAPARISKKLSDKVKEIAVKSVYCVKGYGLFGIELFLGKKDNILVNEIAPRPHNSGHYTIEGCITSQFENHIRSVLDLPLGDTQMVSKFAVMVNILGKGNGAKTPIDFKTALNNDGVHLHIYGKEISNPGRKMGHITICGDDLNSILNIAKNKASKIII
jgi:5-(carboxyamino)imidazole ribonucleotide synthase